MFELISLAKDNAILVIGLLTVTIYLQGRIDSESSATGRELSAMRMEIVGIRGEMSAIREELIGIRQDLHSFRFEITDRFTRIESLPGQPARAM